MAQIASSFKCRICNEPLQFPNDVAITDFIIMMLNFYKIHDLCENLKKSEPALQPAVKLRKQRKKVAKEG